MANKNFWLGILTMVLVFGMTAVGCSSDGESTGNKTIDPKFHGKWKHMYIMV